MLKDYLIKVKSWFTPKEDEIILVITIVLVALIGFGLGRLSVLKENKFPIQIQEPAQEANTISAVKTPDAPPAGGGNLPRQAGAKKAALLVGSKNGRAYHFPWCSGAQRIKEENKIYFSSKEEAEKAGYKPAANCEGL